MDINQFIQDVHQNAVEHGWWDEERTTEEIIALIHSEWSEALEEARAGMPMAYQVQSYGIVRGRIQTDMAKWFPGQKPEGIDIELVDGCIRIFDYIGKEGVRLRGVDTLEQLMDTAPEETYTITLPRLIANLHLKTSQAYQLLGNAQSDEKMYRSATAILFEAVAVSCCWIREKGADAEKLMLKKHEYNKSRPYKHGKKF